MRICVAGLVLITMSIFTGCSVTPIMATGPGTYMVGAHGVQGWSSGPTQEARALKEATAFCQGRNKQLLVIRSTDTPSGFGKAASAEVHFRCINPK
jgi:hypothetical protein